MGACALVLVASAVGVARGLSAGTVSVTRAGEQGARQAQAVERAGDGAAGSAGAEKDRGAGDPSGGAAGAQADGGAGTELEPGATEKVLVHVDGEVASPGVVELAGGSPRVRDAVEAAGGLTDRADTTSLNLAAPVEDGSKVHVPDAVEAAESAQAAEAGASPSGPAAQGTASQVGSPSSGSRVNLNSATAEELQRLPGVGPSTAAKIVEDRAKNGPFASVEDLMRVPGIGEKKLERLRGQAYV